MVALDDDLKAVLAENLGLVWAVARSMHRCRLPLEDRSQAGILGLAMAVRKFDPAQGVWSSYAAWAIESYIRRAEGNAARAARLESLDAADDPMVVDDPADHLSQREDGAILLAVVDQLPEREREIIRRRYWSGEMQKEIGARQGVTRSCIQQIEARALGRLRGMLAV